MEKQKAFKLPAIKQAMRFPYALFNTKNNNYKKIIKVKIK
jgi:hypothetical protein